MRCEEHSEHRLGKKLNLPAFYDFDDHGFLLFLAFASDFEKYNRTNDNYLTTNLFYGIFYDKFEIILLHLEYSFI